jgi:DNA-binding protein HU-beta
VNRNALVAKIARDCGVSKAGATAALESVLDGIVKTLEKGQSITFAGFGTFKTSIRKARAGRNPRTGAAMKIPKRRVARFTAGKRLKAAIR